MPNDSCRVRGDSGPVAVVELVRCRPGVHVASVYAELRDVVVVIPPKATGEDAFDFCQHGFSEGCRMPNDSCRVRGDSGPVAVVELVPSRPRRACCKCVC